MSDCARVEERIVDYLEGDLPFEGRDELTSHIAGCPACQNTVRSYRMIQDAYRAVPEADVAPGVADRILEAARAKRPARRSRRLFLVAAALILAVLIPVVFVSSSDSDDPITVLVRQGDAQLESGELERAESTYEEALATAGDGARAAEVLHRLAALYVAKGEFERALERLNSMIGRYPEYGGRRDVLLLQGEALAGSGRLEQAIQAYRRVAVEFPGAANEVARRVHDLVNGQAAEKRNALQALGYAGN